MAAPLGFFDPELRDDGWFGATQLIEGWYSEDFVAAEVVAAAGQPTPIRTWGIPTGAGNRNRPGGWN